MNSSEEARKLIDAINEYMNVSVKVDYELSDEEEQWILRNIEILKKHIELIKEYEDRKNKENQ